MDYEGIEFTKVWQIDHKLVVAKTIEDAIALYKVYMGEDSIGEPKNVRAVGSNSYIADYEALIKED